MARSVTITRATLARDSLEREGRECRMYHGLRPCAHPADWVAVYDDGSTLQGCRTHVTTAPSIMAYAIGRGSYVATLRAVVGR